MAQRADFGVRDWQKEEYELREGFFSTQILHDLVTQQYYDSHKFAIGYKELQVNTERVYVVLPVAYIQQNAVH